MKNRLVFLLFFLLSLSALLAEVISPKLKYKEDYTSAATLTPSSFKSEILNNDTATLNGNKLAILLTFNESISISGLQLYVNSHEIENLYFSGTYSSLSKTFVIEIENQYLASGKNVIEAFYQTENMERESKKWFFLVDVLEDKIGEPTQLTSSEGWKRNLTPSPNGRFIAYVTIYQNENAIKILDMQTKKEKIIIQSKMEKKFGSKKGKDFFSFAPCWSPLNDRLYFISSKTGYYEIYFALLDTTGNVLGIKPLTNYEKYCSDLVISPVTNTLFFTSNYDSKNMALYSVEGISDINNVDEFVSHCELFADGGEKSTIFSPTVSYNGEFIAYNKQNLKGKSIIEIRKIKSKKIVRIISDENHDFLFPNWSPSSNILCYFGKKTLYTYNLEQSDKSNLIARDCRIPQYSLKPSWDPLGETIYFVNDNTNKSLGSILLNKDGTVKKKMNLLDDKSHRDNMEIIKTKDFKYIIYNSFTTGQWQLWGIEQKYEKQTSVSSFRIKPSDIPIKRLNGKNNKFELLAFSPTIKHKNVYLEFENVPFGLSKYQIGTKNFTQRIHPMKNEPKKFNFESSTKKINFSNGLRSFVLPGWGQKKLFQRNKSKMFLYSTLALGALSIGGYVAEDAFYQDYSNAKDMGHLVKNKGEYVRFNSYKNGFVISASIFYALNIFDSMISRERIPKEFEKEHQLTYRYIKSNIPENHAITGKELNDSGELKLFSNVPKTEVFLKSKIDKKYIDYGATNYSFDPNSYFTITNLKPGNYELFCKKNYFQPIKKTIEIRRNTVSYELLNLKQTPGNKISKFFTYSVPGLSQIKRKETTKGYTISALATSTLITALIFHTSAVNNLDNYNSYKNVNSLIEARSDYYRNSSYRNNFLLLFGLIFTYNLYDAYIGE